MAKTPRRGGEGVKERRRFASNKRRSAQGEGPERDNGQRLFSSPQPRFTREKVEQTPPHDPNSQVL
jgi:hypothetical protein